MDPNDGWHFTAQKDTESFSPKLRENPFKAPRDSRKCGVEEGFRAMVAENVLLEVNGVEVA